MIEAPLPDIVLAKRFQRLLVLPRFKLFAEGVMFTFDCQAEPELLYTRFAYVAIIIPAPSAVAALTAPLDKIKSLSVVDIETESTNVVVPAKTRLPVTVTFPEKVAAPVTASVLPIVAAPVTLREPELAEPVTPIDAPPIDPLNDPPLEVTLNPLVDKDVLLTAKADVPTVNVFDMASVFEVLVNVKPAVPFAVPPSLN